MQANPAPRPPKPPLDHELFVFKILEVVISTQLLIDSLAAGVCRQRALEGRSIGQICPGPLEQLQCGFDCTINLLTALLGRGAMRMDRQMTDRPLYKTLVDMLENCTTLEKRQGKPAANPVSPSIPENRRRNKTTSRKP